MSASRSLIYHQCFDTFEVEGSYIHPLEYEYLASTVRALQNGQNSVFNTILVHEKLGVQFVDPESIGRHAFQDTKGSHKGCRFVPAYGRVPMERQVRSQPNRLKHGENDGDEWRNCVGVGTQKD